MKLYATPQERIQYFSFIVSASQLFDNHNNNKRFWIYIFSVPHTDYLQYYFQF